MQLEEELKPHLLQSEDCFLRTRYISTNYRTESERTRTMSWSQAVSGVLGSMGLITALATTAVATPSALAAENRATSVSGALSTASAAIADSSEVHFALDKAQHSYAQAQAVAAEATATGSADGVLWFHDAAAQERLQQQIATILQDFTGTLGVAVLSPEGLVFLLNDSDFPLMSVMKLPLAYVVALQMQERGDTLSTVVECERSVLDANTYSPLYDQLKGNGFTQVDVVVVGETNSPKLRFPLSLLISYAVGKSDNNACDLLLTHYLPSPQALEQALQDMGLERTHIAHTESAMGKYVELSYANSASLFDMTQMMALYVNDKNLTPEVRQLIDSALWFSSSGAERIQAGVAASLEHVLKDSDAAEKLKQHERYAVYDKTGLGGTNTQWQRIAVNDLALVRIDGQSWVVAACAKNIAGSKEQTIAASNKVLQQVVAAVFTELLAKQELKP